MGSSLFWDVTQRKFIVVSDVSATEMSETCYQSTLRHHPEECRSRLHRSGSLTPRTVQIKTQQFMQICIIDFLVTHLNIFHAVYHCLIFAILCRSPRVYHGTCSGHAVSQPRVRLEPVLAPQFVQTISFLVLQFAFFHSSRTILPHLCQLRLLCHSLLQSAMRTAVRVATCDNRTPPSHFVSNIAM